MNSHPSKLMKQLNKQEKLQQGSSFQEELLQDIYSTICKLQPKNLMLVEFLMLVIQKDFIRNYHKLPLFVQLYDDIRNEQSRLDTTSTHKNNIEKEENKFSKMKFMRLLREMAHRLYPGQPKAYQTLLYQKLTKSPDPEEHRIRLDQITRKLLTRETIARLEEYQAELQGVYEVFLPQNYNNRLDFGWEEIRILEKKLPVICLLRMLHQAEIIPGCLSPNHFMQLMAKLKPPTLPNSSNASSKEVMFYTAETMNTYVRDYAHLPTIRISEGDSGVTFLEFQLIIARIANEVHKEVKNDTPANLRKLFNAMKLKDAFDQNALSQNRLAESVKKHHSTASKETEKVLKVKIESTTNIQALVDSQQEITMPCDTINSLVVSYKDLQVIKKDLDSELAELPAKKKVQKQNNGVYDIEKKHVVIGQQLPKIQEKNKVAPPKEAKKKNEDSLLGYKPEIETQKDDSSSRHKIVKLPKQIRSNKEFPIVLNEVFYPSSINPRPYINPKAELYLETSYIHLGERLYDDAFKCLQKAKQLVDSKTLTLEFYFLVHTAQIYDSAGRDETALVFYHKAKELLPSFPSAEATLKAVPYLGMGSALFHMQQYEYALRCFEKARSLHGIGLQAESIDNAILQNDIGCCLMMLERNQQAAKYFEISHSVLDLKVGVFDERTLAVQQNFNKNKKAYLQMLPQFRTMWKTYVQKTTKLPAVKVAKKK